MSTEKWRVTEAGAGVRMAGENWRAVRGEAGEVIAIQGGAYAKQMIEAGLVTALESPVAQPDLPDDVIELAAGVSVLDAAVALVFDGLTIDEVLQRIEDGAFTAADALAQERAGKGRKTLIARLEGLLDDAG